MEGIHADAVASEDEKRHIINFRIVQFLLGLFTATTVYMSAYLKELGLQPALVALFTSLRSAVGVVVPVVWGLLCDKFRTVKKVFFFCVVCIVLLYPTVPLFERFPLWGLLTMAPVMIVVIRIFYRPVGTIFSSWVIQMRDQLPHLVFGKIQIYRSIAYSLGSIALTGLVANFSSVRIAFYAGGVLAVVIIIAMRPLPDVKPDGNMRHIRIKDLKLGRLFRDPLLVAMFVVMIFSNIPFSSSGIFLPYLLDDVGANVSMLGAFNAIRSLCGIPLMFVSDRLVRWYGARRVMTLSILVMGIGEFLFSGTNSTFSVLSLGVLIGVNGGLLAVSRVIYADKLAPAELRSTVQMISAASFAMGDIISSVLGGSIVGTLGVRAYYRTSGSVVILALIVFVVVSRFLARKKADGGKNGDFIEKTQYRDD